MVYLRYKRFVPYSLFIVLVNTIIYGEYYKYYYKLFAGSPKCYFYQRAQIFIIIRNRISIYSFCELKRQENKTKSISWQTMISPIYTIESLLFLFKKIRFLVILRIQIFQRFQILTTPQPLHENNLKLTNTKNTEDGISTPSMYRH